MARSSIPNDFNDQHRVSLTESNFTDEEDESQMLPADRTRGASPVIGSDGQINHKETCQDKMIHIAKIAGPHIGLVLLLGLYVVIGAGVFYFIESPNERATRAQTLSEIWARRDFLVNNLWNMSKNGSEESEWKDFAYETLDKLEDRLFLAFRDEFLVSDDIRKVPRSIWSFPTAVFFACTIITTIGYGHIVPITPVGRITCIVFGLFGIPLLLITIADIGKFMSDFITYLYRSYRLLKFKIRRRSRKFSQSHKFSRSKTSDIDLPPSPQSEAADSTSSSQLSEDIHIPIWMVLIFLATYTALGGVLFRYMEGWDYFESFYFCFITMSTIGFGDFVPTSQIYMLFTLIYIVIGLAITTMCIDLAGTEYIRRFHYVGQKIETAQAAMGDVMVGGIQLRGDLMTIMKHAGGKFISVKDMSAKQLSELRERGLLPAEFDLYQYDDGRPVSEKDIARRKRQYLENVLWQPLSPDVAKFIKPHMKIRPDEIGESDAVIVENSTFERPLFQRRYMSAECLGPASFWPRRTPEYHVFVAPFILKESNV